MTDGSLTRREGRPALGGPYEGVPNHLRRPLRLWVLEQFVKDDGRGLRTDLLYRVMAAERIEVRENHAEKPEGNSVWTTDDYEDGLVRRVDATATAAYEQAASPSDKASTELYEAWMKVYGRDADPADAWDHAIKAVEAILIPIVEPNNTRATLGSVLGILRNQSSQWRLVIRGRVRDHSIDALVQMLDLIWVDPNRHGSGSPEPEATLEEAQAIVHLAVTIVQWGRDEVLRKA